MPSRDDDVAVLGPLLFVVGLLIALGLYNKAQKAWAPPPPVDLVEEAEIYATAAEAELRKVVEDNRDRFD